MEFLNISKGTARKIVTELEKFLLLKIEKEDVYDKQKKIIFRINY